MTTVTAPEAAPHAPRAHAATFSYLPALDGLRGLSVAAVLMFHAGHFRGGFLGVDLFFALSGFLITTLLLREVETTGGVDLKRFWGRRMKRLMPAAVVTLVVATLLLYRFASVAEQVAAVEDGPWAQFYLANWHQLSGTSGYWASFELPRAFSHMWSLAIEEQFYMVWPVVVLVCARATRSVQRSLFTLTMLGCTLSLGAMIVLYDRADPTRVYMGSDTRAASILIGAFFATAPLRRAVATVHRSIGGGLQWVCVMLMAGLGVAWATIDGLTTTWLFQGGLFAHSTVAALLVACCAHTPNGWVSRVLGVAPLRVLGTLSYSLYLWHWPVYVLCNEERTGWSGWSLVGLRLVVSLTAAVASKLLVEDPVRFHTGWLRGRPAVATFAGAMALGGLFWVLLPRPDTAPAAFDPAGIEALRSTTTLAGAPDGTDTTGPPTTTAPRPRVSRVLFLGDSVAYDEQPAIEAALRAAGLTAEVHAFPGHGVLSDRVDVWPGYTDLIARLQPDLVIYQLSVWDLGSVDAQQAAYERLVGLVRDNGSSLLLLGMPPFAVVDAKSTLPQLPAIAEALAARDPEHIAYLPVGGAWGTTYAQDVDGDGVPERKPDGTHMCPAGAARIAVWLTDRLAALYEGVSPGPVGDWVSGPWRDDARYRTPPGICANVTSR